LLDRHEGAHVPFAGLFAQSGHRPKLLLTGIRGEIDKCFVSRASRQSRPYLFAERAAGILETAEMGIRQGNTLTEMTFLVNEDGSLQMICESDWPLESLVSFRGARSGYRIAQSNGVIRVVGREAHRTLTLETRNPASTARFLLGLRQPAFAPPKH
jgi:hypothetical protein